VNSWTFRRPPDPPPQSPPFPFTSSTANQTVTPDGIASGETFGTLVVQPGAVTVTPDAIASGETFGAFQVNLTIFPTAISSGETFGALAAVPGPVTVTPTAIASGEAFGTLQANLNASPDGIASGEAFGTLQANLNATPTAIASGETFGTTQVNLNVPIAGIASGEAFGTLAALFSSTPDAIASGEAFGTLQVNLNAAPTGIASGEAFGVLHADLVIYPAALSSGETFGALSAVPGPVTVTPTAIASGEAFGSPTAGGADGITIDSGEAFGTLQVNQTIHPQGIWTQEVFGTVQVGQPQTASPTGIVSAGAFGTLEVTGGITTVTPDGIASGEALGPPTGAHAQPAGIDSGEAFGLLQVNLSVPIAGLGSEEAFGNLTATCPARPVGISSGEAFGTMVATAFGFVGAGDITVVMAGFGIAPHSACGTPEAREPWPTSARRPSFIAYDPDWGRPVTVTGGWQTLIVQNREAGEQRQRIRSAARYRIAYERRALTPLEFVQARAKAIRDTGLPVVVPLWTEYLPLLVVSANSVQVDGPPSARFKAGSWIYVRNGSTACFRRVLSITASVFALGTAADDADPAGFNVATLPVGSRVYPCVLGMFPDGLFRFVSSHPESQDQTVEVEEL